MDKNNYEVEWYSGRNGKTRPKRVKVSGVWRDVFKYEKEIREDFSTRKRKVIFNCHIGDNEMVRVEIEC